MSDSKSILDFVAKSNQQFASKRKVLNFDNNNNTNQDSTSTDNNINNSSSTSNSNNNNASENLSSSSTAALTPAQHMQQRLLAQQTGSFYATTATSMPTSFDNSSSSSSSSLISSLITGKKSSSSAPGGRQELVQTWQQKIQAFIADHTQTKMECPTLLSGADRRELHLLAQKYNLSHNSVGAGTQRRMVIAKDALFYQGSAAGVNNITNNNFQNDVNGNEEQKTKGQLRRERQEKRENQNEKDLYADKTAYKMLQKYSTAVNPFAQAVQVGDHEFDNDDDDFGGIFMNNNNKNEDAAATSSNIVHNNNNSIEHHHETRRRQRNDQDYDENDNHHQEIIGNNNNEDDDESNNTTTIRLPDPEWTTCDQIVEAAGVNEFSAADIGWIQDFAEQCCSADDAQNNRTQRIVFCIDVADFVTSCSFLTRLKAGYNNNKRQGGGGGGVNFGVVQLSARKKTDENDDASNNIDGEFESLKQQFDSVVARIVAIGENLENQICLCLPGNPLFGEALQVAVAFPIYRDQAIDLQKTFQGLDVDSVSLN